MLETGNVPWEASLPGKPGARGERGVVETMESWEVGANVVDGAARVGLSPAWDHSATRQSKLTLFPGTQGLEYGDKNTVLHGLTPTYGENISGALERKKLAVLVSRPDGSWRLLGSTNPYLNEALQFVMHQKEITARDLADDTQGEISLASTKLFIQGLGTVPDNEGVEELWGKSGGEEQGFWATLSPPRSKDNKPYQDVQLML
jgi:hypothetical protein